MGPRPDGRGRAQAAAAYSNSQRGVNGAAAGWPRKAASRCRTIDSHWGVNGAAAGWPRKASTLRGASFRQPSVNGAAAGWPRKGRRRGTTTWATPRVNGAAAGWPRKVANSSKRSARAMRQWGRGRMAAEGCAAQDSRPDPEHASMGPRPDGRGRSCCFSLSWDSCGCVNGAAAGWPRKALPIRCRAADSTAASMGPRPDGRGRRRRQRPSPHLVRLRQWGRGRMAAEGSRRQAVDWTPPPRQWGRGRMAAEGLCRRPGREGRSASMGPRPDGRGRATGRPWRARSEPASMGPRPDGRGRPSSGSGSPTTTNCVNGAAAGWPRKAGHEPDTPDHVPSASMGPRPDGRGRALSLS